MMDDGRLVLCQHYLCQSRLLIFNTDVSNVDSIPVQYKPHRVIAVNNSTVAVTVWDSNIIEMFDINNKHKLKSLTITGMGCFGITTINNKLVAGGKDCLCIIDHQTGEEMQTIHLGDCFPYYLHASGDRIFYRGEFPRKNLYCYDYKNKDITKSIPSISYKMTSLQDGSLYVLCWNGSVQHVSSDGKHYQPVTTEGLKSLKGCYVISYNKRQRKLFTCTNSGTVNIYGEK